MGVPTPAGQETAIGEGLALGCLRLGVVGFSAGDLAVDAAFVLAWQEWSEAQFFPAVRASPERIDIRRVLRSSEKRRYEVRAAWSCGDAYRPYVRGWTLDEVAAGLLETVLVTGQQWEALARSFTVHLGEEHLERAG